MLMSRSKYRSSVDLCADCGASDPSWASVNRGLLLCAECCSVHRSMGRHISHVKSLRQGSWPPSLLAMINAMTAQNVNSIWEHSLLDTSAPKHLRKKPQPKDPLHPTKSEFIFAKHLKLEYVLHARRDEPPAELGRQLHSAVRSASLDTALRLLAQGADPNYYNEEKGSTCLHVACRAGQPSQAELLVCWGADPTARDRNGCTPSDCARQGGHLELAQRMVELVYEATDKLIVFLTGERPQHGAGSHYIAPRPRDAHEMTDVAKAARGKLQLLPNHLFEELVMDIYDEIDRRETEEIWQTSASGLERCGVVFLPVNPALSAPRNQGRQKLARLSSTELLALLRDVLVDATRRQHIATLQPRGPYNPLLSGAHHRQISHMSDDEPLYDSVASDDDYAALIPAVDFEMLNATPRMGETVSVSYNPSLPADIANEKPKQLSQLPSTSNIQLETLKKELDNRDSTISELKSQLKNLQTIVEQLTKENSVLKVSADDTQSMVSQNSVTTPNETSTNGLEEKVQERGKSMETEQMTRISDEGAEFRLKSNQRPVSMYETREGPKNNWQVTKHQLTTLSGLDRSLTQSVLEGGAVALPSADVVERKVEPVTRGIQDLWASATSANDQQPILSEGGAVALPSADVVERRVEPVTRGIQDLWASATSANDQQPVLLECGETIRHAVRELLAIFPNNCPDRDINLALNDLRSACQAVTYFCTVSSSLDDVRLAAFDLAKATKHLLTHFNVNS